LVPTALSLFIFLTALTLLSKIVISNSSQYVFDKDIELLFLGDSHITNSVIDSLVPNSLNLSKRSESYYYTLQKLKFVSKKSKIKKVILGYSDHNITAYYDEFINGHLSLVMPHKLFFILDFKEKLRVLNWNKTKLISFFKQIVLSAYYQYQNHENSKLEYWFSDGFHNSFKETEANVFAIKKRISFQFYKSKKLIRLSDLNIFYLKEIISFCIEHNIELIFLKTPLHLEYCSRVPEMFKFKYKNLIKENNIRLINLEKLNLTDSNYVPDGDHVTLQGAEITTRALKEILR
jgi:hypothetical protein